MMKKTLANLVCALALGAACSAALAQVSGVIKPAPNGTAPAVESVDILKQNQAERTREQPGNLAPTMRVVKDGTAHYSSLPALESGVLVQAKAQFPGQARATTAGQAWREYRNGPLTRFGGWLLLLVLVGIGAFYWLRGPIKLKQGRTGRLIERFTSVERIAHWSVAISFVVLMVTGLTILFGKYVLLPVFGHTLFGWLAYLLKNLHNFAGPVFMVSIVVFFVIYVKDNLPTASRRFNFGEKMWFWGGMVVLGLVSSASGFVLDMLVPGIEYTRANMQLANVIHIVGAVLIAAGSFGHIYLGTIGMEGAYEGMRTGYVDDTWAREHHEGWYQDVVSGKVARVRSEEGAAQGGAPLEV